MSNQSYNRSMLNWLHENEFWAVKIPGSRFMRGIPDILAVRDGLVYFFEGKKPGDKPTKLQEKIIADLRTFGACAGVVHNVAEMKKLIEEHLQQRSKREAA